MTRRIAMLVLFAASVAGGIWMLTLASAPRELARRESAGSCDEDSACSTVVSGEEHGEPAAAPTPGAVATEPARENPDPAAPPAAAAPRPPAPAPDAAQLRADADRLIAEGHIAEGIAAMRKAAEAEPSARNEGDLGALLQKVTVFDEAAVHLARAAQLDPNNADRWIALANINYLRVNPGDAWKAERKAREVEPGLVLGRSADGLRVRQSDSAAGAQ